MDEETRFFGDEDIKIAPLTEKDYQELQQNLILYKQGNAEATTYICKAFHLFIAKYAKFISYGHLSHNPYVDRNGKQRYKVDSSLSSFISLFYDKKLSKEVGKSKAFSMTCTKIKSLFSKYEYGDIYNELVLALLNMANKYKITKEGDLFHKKNGTFHMYVQKCFHWEAYAFLKKLIKDPLCHYDVLQLCDQFDKIDFSEEDNLCYQCVLPDEKAQFELEEMFNNITRENSLEKTSLLTMKEDKKISAYDDECLNFNWINGITCSELFENLNSYERELIILYYVQNKTDEEIGVIYNTHRTTINKQRRKAIEKIKEKAIKANCLDI